MKEKILAMLKELQPTIDFEDGNDYVENGYLDSFDIVQLVAALESEFNIIISALEITPENFCSMQAICDLVNKKKCE